MLEAHMNSSDTVDTNKEGKGITENHFSQLGAAEDILLKNEVPSLSLHICP